MEEKPAQKEWTQRKTWNKETWQIFISYFPKSKQTESKGIYNERNFGRSAKNLHSMKSQNHKEILVKININLLNIIIHKVKY